MNASDYNWCPTCKEEPEPDCKYCDAIRESLRIASLIAKADLRLLDKRNPLADRESQLYYMGYYDEQ